MATVDMLEDLGHSVIETGLARDALAMLDKAQVDILLTDVGLPDMPGTALVAKAREKRPDLPVVFATGHSRVEGVEIDERTALVVKPYQPSHLAAAVAKIAALLGPR